MHDETSGWVVLFYVLIVLFALGTLGVQIFFNVTFYKNIQALQTSDNEIKSKIGSLVRDINFINKQEYNVDVELSQNINKLGVGR